MAWISEAICPVCGKKFCFYPGHLYKYKSKRVCSYKCELKAERDGLTKKIKSGII